MHLRVGCTFAKLFPWCAYLLRLKVTVAVLIGISSLVMLEMVFPFDAIRVSYSIVVPSVSLVVIP